MGYSGSERMKLSSDQLVGKKKNRTDESKNNEQNSSRKLNELENQVTWRAKKQNIVTASGNQ